MRFNRASARGIIIFAFGYALVDLLPVLLPGSVLIGELALPDAADAALIFVLVILYVELGSQANLYRSLTLRVAYTGALLVMVQGHAVHFAANAITRVGEPGAPGWSLAYFLDEHWGHVELHAAFLVLGGIFIGCGRSAAGDGNEVVVPRLERLALWVATLLYGLLLAGDSVEGQTVPLMLPAALLLCAWGFAPLLKGWIASGGPVLSLYRRFFAASFGVAAAALVVYGLMMGGFPELSASPAME